MSPQATPAPSENPVSDAISSEIATFGNGVVTMYYKPSPSGVQLIKSISTSTFTENVPFPGSKSFQGHLFNLGQDGTLTIDNQGTYAVYGSLAPTPTTPATTLVNSPSSTTALISNPLLSSVQSGGTHSGSFTSPIQSNQQGSSATDAAKPNSPALAASKNGVTSGAVVGVAIGCFIAGLLLAAVIAWLCLGRARRGVRARRDHEASVLALMHREKGPAAKTSSLESGSPVATALDNGLPQPLEDKAISGEISKISNSIKNHIQSYYHTGRVSPGMIDFEEIQALGSDLPVSVGTLSTLLGNSATREIALRFCIAWVVISRMQLFSPPAVSFLPPEVARSLQSMSLVDRGSRVHAMFFAKWRTLTAELMQSTYVRNAFSASDARLQSIQSAASILEDILRPYADPRMDNRQRIRNLEEILKRAALFAFTLFSQPSSWDFDWQTEEGVKAGSLCIFPALVQVVDENGETVKPPRPFNDAVIRRLDE